MSLPASIVIDGTTYTPNVPPTADGAKPVIVRAYSGVFFGYLVSKDGSSCVLRDARQIHSWDSKGLPEPSRTCGDIANAGVGSGSNVSTPCRVTLEQVGAIFDASPTCVESLNSQKWGKKC